MNAKPALQKFLAPALLILLPLLAYWPVLRGGFIWDDDVLITENPIMKIPGGLAMIWRGAGVPDYFPIPYSMFWLEWHVFGYFAPGYHIVNVALHIIGAVLVWRILRRLKVPGAFLAALIFAVHPVGAASVAWISEGKNTWSLIFFALTVVCWLKSENEETTNIQRSTFNAQQFYFLSLGSFLLALLSKSSVVMLPVVLFGCVWWQRKKISARDVRRTIPFFALSLAAGLVTLWFQKYRAGTVNFSQPMNFAERLAGAGWAVWFYFFQALWPAHLMPIHPNPTIQIASIAAWLPLAALLGIFLVNWKFRRSWGRPVLFALGYFILLLLPILGFFDIYYFLFSRVADHWNYLALIGLAALVAGGWNSIFKSQNNFVSTGGATAMVLTLFFLTRHQAALHADAEIYWRDAVEKNPSAWAAHGNLAGMLRERKKIDAAIFEYKEALRLNPNFANAHLELGETLAGQGKIPEAIARFTEAVRLEPGLSEAHYDLAIALEGQNKLDEAKAQYIEVVRLTPTNFKAHNNLGNIFWRRGAADQALAHFQEAVRLQPDFALAHANLGRVLASQNKLDEAARHFSDAIRFDPNFLPAYSRLAEVLNQSGQRNEAIAQLKRALQINPDFAEAKQLLQRLE